MDMSRGRSGDGSRGRDRRDRVRRSRGGSRSRERWERHYSEKFGLDDRGANAGRDGGKSVEEWTKYYEEKYGLSK